MSSYKKFKAEKAKTRAKKLLIVVALLLLIIVLMGAFAYVASRMLTGKALFDPIKVSVSAAAPLSAAASQAASSASAPQSEAQPANSQPASGTPDAAAPAPAAWNVATPIAERTVNLETPVFDNRMTQLPENGRVNMEYFRTAMFVGDSLAQGFGTYEPMRSIATVCAYKGVGPQQIVENNTGELPDRTKVPMWEYICQQHPEKIYLAIGINAMVGQSDEAFTKYYGDLLNALVAQFPGVPIYVQSITPVTAETAINRPNLNNDRIHLLNQHIALMAAERNLYYLNLHEVLADETGALRADIASTKDGIHMRSSEGYNVWIDYLRTHTAPSPANQPFLEVPYTA